MTKYLQRLSNLLCVTVDCEGRETEPPMHRKLVIVAYSLTENASILEWTQELLVLQCSDCRKTYAKKFLRPYFLCRSKQGNEDC